MSPALGKRFVPAPRQALDSIGGKRRVSTRRFLNVQIACFTTETDMIVDLSRGVARDFGREFSGNRILLLRPFQDRTNQFYVAFHAAHCTDWRDIMQRLIGLIMLLIPALVWAQNEDAYNAAFCATVGGQSYVRVDCETGEMVYEGGLDKRSSLDSVQQALFFAHLTGKQPAVVIYDTDGQMGRFEHRIQVACERAGVQFIRNLQE